jgi:hypothetical protein
MIQGTGVGEIHWVGIYTAYRNHNRDEILTYWVKVASGVWASLDGIAWHWMSTKIEFPRDLKQLQERAWSTEMVEKLNRYAWQLSDPLSQRKRKGSTDVVVRMGESR